MRVRFRFRMRLRTIIQLFPIKSIIDYYSFEQITHDYSAISNQNSKWWLLIFFCFKAFSGVSFSSSSSSSSFFLFSFVFFLLLIKTNTDLISSHIDWVDQERPVWEYTRTETVWYKALPRRRLNGLYSTHRLRSVEPTKICCRLAWILYLELLRPECCDGFSSGFTSIHCGFLFSQVFCLQHRIGIDIWIYATKLAWSDGGWVEWGRQKLSIQVFKVQLR